MIIKGEKRVELPVKGPLYLPFYNIWAKNVYWQSGPFDMNPFTLRAHSTSGSPVVLGEGSFAGFLKGTDGSFAYDGKGTLTVTAVEGQEIYYERDCDPFEAWRRYNAVVLDGGTAERAPYHWKDLEYCTWVEQKRQAAMSGKKNAEVLTEEFVYDYLRRIQALGLPRGKLTIDGGWGGENWEPNRVKFPHFEKLIETIANEGYTPSLWFAPGYITYNPQTVREHPEWVGLNFTGNTEETVESGTYYYKPIAELKSHYKDAFRPYVQMGVRKFKMDLYYEDKHVMKALLRPLYEAMKELDETVEVEIHIPDIFVSRYGDTVRTHDAFIRPDGEWRGVVKEHYTVCRYSAPDKVINLDHVGSNSPDVGEDDFLEHLDMLLSYDGYPVVSLIPDHFSKKTIDKIRIALLERYPLL